MTIALGIDTGGTYTDAVLVEHETGQVLAGAKALTTRRDLSIGIEMATANVFAANSHAVLPEHVNIVGLSTTLATNAIVENQGSPVCLLLIGYDEELIKKHQFDRELATRHFVFLRGGHNGQGEEIAPLDEEAARQAILAHREQVEAFAVSGFFSVRNPAHELRVKALIEELTRTPDGSNLPVTCGHQLTSQLNSVRRATTAALNARLIPLLHELMTTVQGALTKIGVSAPLMVVKGDGSLVSAEWAMQRPIETILSGPAASVVGARHLARQGDVWVVDMGGTTTDIAALTDGRPRLNPQGAQVGRWRTMVEAADVHTVGLGGDSQIQIDQPYAPGQTWVTLAPQRVIPLYLLARQNPAIIQELKLQWQENQNDRYTGLFVQANRRPTRRISDDDRKLLDLLAPGPRSLVWLATKGALHRFILARQVERLQAQRLVLLAGFTPSDALHVLGLLDDSPPEASRLGAQLLARQANLPVDDFCRRVIDEVSRRVAVELVSKVLADESALPDWSKESTARELLARALVPATNQGLACQLTLRQPIVAIGAPVAAYLPQAAQALHTSLVVPPHAEVANAVGAVVGGVVQEARILIQPLEGLYTGYRLYLPNGVHTFRHLDETVDYARQIMTAHLEEQTLNAGAAQVEISMKRHDDIAPINPQWGGEIYLGTHLIFTAMGRPKF